MFLNYLNNFRGFAMLFIVAYHIFPAVRWIENSASEKIIYLIFSNCSILFMFISGFLFQYLLRKYSYVKYLKKKFQFVILPYIFMSIPAILLIFFGPKFGIEWNSHHTDKPVFLRIITFYLTGSHLSQFWFIPMIIFYYLTAPLFKLIDTHPKFYLTLPLFITLSIIIGRPAGNDNPLHSFLFYLPVYLTGMVSSHYLEKTLQLLEKYFYFLLTILLGLSVILFFNDIRGVSLVQKILLCLIVLHVFKKLDNNRILNKLDIVATYSFGIYFIHMYVIIVILKVMKSSDLDIFRSMGILSFILLTVITTIISVLLLKFIKFFNKKNSRIVIGC
jgi:peptidoglycan/LPS O-acetylase OafA/YrhL